MVSTLVLLAACLPTPAFSAEAPPTTAPPAFDEGRLFTTAAQRERLDAIRAGTPRDRADKEADPRFALPTLPERKPAPEPPTVYLHGFVRRSSGPEAIWANGESTLAGGRLPDDTRIQGAAVAGATVRVTLPDGRTIRLKPGQVWDPDVGRVIDGYRR